MRKFGIKYAQLHPEHKQVRAGFCSVKQAGAWRDVLKQWYSSDGPGTVPKVDEPNPVQTREVRAADNTEVGNTEVGSLQF